MGARRVPYNGLELCCYVWMEVNSSNVACILGSNNWKCADYFMDLEEDRKF